MIDDASKIIILEKSNSLLYISPKIQLFSLCYLLLYICQEINSNDCTPIYKNKGIIHAHILPRYFSGAILSPRCFSLPLQGAIRSEYWKQPYSIICPAFSVRGAVKVWDGPFWWPVQTANPFMELKFCQDFAKFAKKAL